MKKLLAWTLAVTAFVAVIAAVFAWQVVLPTIGALWLFGVL